MTRRRERGFALLIVLWTLVLLALLGSHLLADSRADTQLARNLEDAAALKAQTQGAVQQAIFQLMLPPGRGWEPDGTTHVMRAGNAVIAIRLEDEAGKVNLNTASETLLRALLVQLGAPPATAASVAAAIADWRTAGDQPRPLGAKAAQYLANGRDYGPPGDDFRSIDELGLVLGVTPELLARLRPHVTVYTDGDPDGSTQDPVVAAALGYPQPTASAPGLTVASVIAEAKAPGHAAFHERVVVRLNGAAGGHPYDILALDRTIPAPAPGS